MAQTYEEMRILSIKPYLTVNEASDFFGIGINKVDKISKEPNCEFVLRVGRKKLINREKFAVYLENRNVV